MPEPTETELMYREMEKLGYDIESRIPNTGKLRFIEVKGRSAAAATTTVRQGRAELRPRAARRPQASLMDLQVRPRGRA